MTRSTWRMGSEIVLVMIFEGVLGGKCARFGGMPASSGEICPGSGGKGAETVGQLRRARRKFHQNLLKIPPDPAENSTTSGETQTNPGFDIHRVVPISTPDMSAISHFPRFSGGLWNEGHAR